MSFCTNCGKEVLGTFCSNCGTKIENEQTVNEAPKQNLKETIEALYGLRAGLSMVALESDKIKEEKNLLKDTEIRIQESKHSLNVQKKFYENKKSRMDKLVEDENRNVEANNSELSKEILANKQIMENNKKYLKISKILFTFFVISWVLIGVSLFSCAAILAEKTPVFLQVSVFVVPILCIIYLVSVANNGDLHEKVFAHSDYKDACKRLKQLESEPFEQIETADMVYANNSEYQKTISEIRRCDDELANLDTKYQIEEKSQNAIEKITVFTQDGERIYNALVNTYSSVLDPRDWEHIDVLIYILETGRADTFKEALQQLDLYRHTDKIAHAVRDANNAICSTIRSEINRLGTAIVACANSINNQLEKIALSQNKISEGISKSIEAANLQNALLEKSVISSNELLKSVNVIKDYASNTEKISQDIKFIHNNKNSYLY